MKKSTIKWIIALMSISLIGLVGFQLYWIDTVLKANEERFTKDVMDAMHNVALKLEKQETAAAFHKLRSVAALKPDFRSASRNRMQRPPGQSQTDTAELKERTYGADGNPQAYRQLNLPTPKFYLDTVWVGNQYRVSINYEFSTTFPNAFSPQKSPSQPGNQELEMELAEKQSEIESLEEKLNWISKKYEMTASVMDDLLAPNRRLSSRFNPEQLDSLLRTELNDKGVKIPFNYGVYASKPNKFVFVNAREKKKNLQNSTLKASLFPNDLNNERAFLILDFPEKSQYLLQKIWLTMVSSGLLVLIIIFCFGYSIRTILRQKKLSMMKNDFINNMTHELKTPIATVSLATEALQDKTVGQSDDMRTRYIHMIQNENSRLGSQVERVLQIAAIDKQDFHLKLEELDIHEMIQGLVENMKIQVEKREGRIISVLSARDYLIRGDGTHVSNCIMNLLDNAIKYSMDAPNIIVRTENRNDQLFISVQDHGMGMTKETQKRVFEKFYRLPTGDRHDVKGFGLGLSYVKSMVEAHKGEILLESTSGKGSKFTIILPLAA